MHDLQTFERRLNTLERSNRRWRAATLLCALVAVTASFAAPALETIRASGFVLVADDGTELGSWKIDPKGKPYFHMSSGEASALITMHGPAINLAGDDGKRGAFVGVDSKGESRLELRSERFVDGARVVVKEDGTSGLFLLDENGRERATMEHLSTGNSQFTARDPMGRIGATVGMDARGLPNLLLFDSAGRRRIGMAVQTTTGDIPLFSMEDQRGRNRFEATMDLQGEPRVRTLRPDGGSSFQAP